MGCCDSKHNNLDRPLKYQYRKRMKLKNYLDGAENHNPLTTFTESGCCLHNAANLLNDDQVVFTMIKSRAQLAQERLRREHERMGIVPPRPVSLISERDTDLNKPP